VADVPHKTGTPKKSLLPLWLAAFYCIVVGAFHVFSLAQELYQMGDTLDWLLPVWAYPLGFIQPTVRLAAGISLVRRSRLSRVFLVVATVVTAIFPILWQCIWTWQTGKSSRLGSIAFFVIPDLLVMLAITRYAFSLKSRGMLR
jgi:hypothetical protein